MHVNKFKQFFCRFKSRKSKLLVLVICFVLAIPITWVRMCDFSFQQDFETNPPAYPHDGIGKPVDLGKLDFTVVNNLCHTDKPLIAVISVFSTITHFKLRAAMRETLGQFCASFGCRLVFTIGLSDNKHFNAALHDELEEQHDILVVDRIDTYWNMADKVALMIGWIDSHCRNAKYVIQTNDDVYINIPRFVEELDFNEGEKCNCMLGHGSYCAIPNRNPASKHYISYEAYPGTKFPLFFNGAAYAFPNALTPVLHSAIYKAKYCWLDDIWFTGLVRHYSGIRLVHTNSAVLYGKFNPSIIKTHLFFHDVDENTFHMIHREFTKFYISSGCSIDISHIAVIIACIYFIL